MLKLIFTNIIAIFRKEFQSYFTSPFAYVIVSIFWLLSGFFFIELLLGSQGIIQSVAAQEQMGFPLPPTDVAYEFIRAFLGVMGTLILFILPLLSMGLYTEEKKGGTLELLATSPVTNWAVALGKLLGVVTFFTFMVLPLFIYQGVTLSVANPPIQLSVALLANGSLILLAAAILSLGMFVSSLTESTILSAIVTFVLVLFLWILDSIANQVTGWGGEVLSHLSLLQSYENLTQGILDLGSIVILLSYIFLGIFLTAQSIEAFKFGRS